MQDFGYAIRQEFIHESRLQTKLDALRERLHGEGKFLVGEEVLAKRLGGTIFHAHRGWKPAREKS